jgi:hypothetical protein
MSTHQTYATAETRTGARTGTDPWAAANDAENGEVTASLLAPRTFDPFCTRRLRNCVDDENAAMPDS